MSAFDYPPSWGKKPASYILEEQKLVFSQISTYSLGPGVVHTDVTPSKKSYMQQETRMG